MSDRLALSAAFSILAMSTFTLFSDGASRIDLTPSAQRAAMDFEAPSPDAVALLPQSLR